MRPSREGCGAEAGRKGRESGGARGASLPGTIRGGHCCPPAGPGDAGPPRPRSRIVFLRGSLPGLAPGRRRRPPRPARRLLSSRGHGVALGPPLRVSASASAALVPGSRGPRSSGSAQAGAALRTPSPGSGGRRARQAAAAAEAGGGDAAEALGLARRPLLLGPGRPASAGRPRRRRAPGAGAARRALRASRRELRPGRGGGQSRRSPSSGRQEAPCRAPATAQVAEPSSRPRRPAAGADMGARGCAPGPRTLKVC